jgi:3',5'-cyclic-AMP phosphodiesterase
MMTFVIAHISDTHLSDEKDFFHDNFNIVLADIQSKKFDLVINTGDVSLNGADDLQDLIDAHAMHADFGLPWKAIPGNHDIGDNQEIATKQPTNAERRQRWLDVFGPDWWLHDVPGWRLVGLNSLLLGSNLPEAADQERFLSDAVEGLDGRMLALFLHKPLFHDTLADTDVSGHVINPEPRKSLLSALDGTTPALVCVGHLHEYRERSAHGIHQVWAPAVSFTLSDWYLPTHGGTHIVGYMHLELHEDGSFNTQLVQPAGQVAHDIADFPGAYGDIRAKMAAVAELAK